VGHPGINPAVQSPLQLMSAERRGHVMRMVHMVRCWSEMTRVSGLAAIARHHPLIRSHERRMCSYAHT
jgi:hypothetical protein